MKRILIIITILVCWLQGQPRTLEIVYSNESITLKIDEYSVDASNAHKFIGLQIDLISVIENPKLSKRKAHVIKIGDKEVAGKDLKLMEVKKIKLENPFTIKLSDVLSAYRDEKVIGKFQFKIDSSEIQNNVSITPNYTGSDDQFVLKSESDTITYTLNNPEGYHINSIIAIDADGNPIGEIEYNSGEANSIISIPVTLKNSTKPTTVHLEITSPLLKDTRIPIDCVSTISISKTDSTKSVIIALCVFAVIVACILIYMKIRKRKTADGLGTSSYPETNNNYDPEGPHDSSVDGNNTNSDPDHEDKTETHGQSTEELNGKLSRLNDELSAAKDSVATLKEQLANANSSNQELTAQVADLQKTINSQKTLKNENEKLKKENNELLKIRDAANDLKERNKKCVNMIQELKDEAQEKEKQMRSLNDKLLSAENSKASKDRQITTLNKDIDGLNHYLKEEKKKSADLQLRLDGFSRQTHYLYLIDEALSNIDKTLPLAFRNVTDETMRRKLVDPVVVGTPGLDENGMESYKMLWRDEVYENQAKFFGKDVRNLKDDEVVELLRENFLENLALRDSFNKLVRLYLYSNVGWLNTKLVEAGFDVDAIQTLFIELRNMFSRFGIEISYPHLFIDTFDNTRHRDSRRCDIFSVFEPTQEVETMMRTKNGEDLIVDLVRIGLPQSKTATRRLPMVSLPNF